MKLTLTTLGFLMVFASCGQSKPKEDAVAAATKKGDSSSETEAVAYFAEGCFWHSELVFQSLVGVNDAVSGYAGGTDPKPDYEKVSTGATGHAEAVEVHYDPKKISFETLVKAFFASQDPTTLNSQGNDTGTEYRSIAFYRNTEEKKVIENEIKRLTDEKKYVSKIVTEVKPYTVFYKAEAYHQEYISQNPGNSYVEHVSIPDFLKFKNEFKGNFK